MVDLYTSAKARAGTLSSQRAELLRLMLAQRSLRHDQIQRAPRTECEDAIQVPISSAQERLWFIEQLEGRHAGYQVPLTVRLHGKLDESSLRRALNTIMERHEALRTTFTAESGAPLAIVRQIKLPLEVIDLWDYERDVRESELRRRATEATHAPFDLQKGPLIRACVFHLEPDEHVLLIVMHHIVCDGWSKNVLLNEIATLYSAYTKGSPDPLTPLPLQYADYAHWQSARLAGNRLNKQLAYWHDRLKGAPPQLELPTDRTTPAGRGYSGKNFALDFDTRMSAGLRALARRHKLTLFMVLYAGWAVLLSRLSGQTDITVGMPIANRQQRDLEPLIGLFANTLVLRTQVDNDLRVEEFLQHIRHTVLEAFEDQDAPVEKVVERLRPERIAGRNPLFQVAFALKNMPPAEAHFTGMTAAVEDIADEPAMFDLTLFLEERGEKITGIVNYATEILNETTIRRWMSCYRILLESMVLKEGAHLGALPLMSPEEQRQLVTRFNATATSYPRDCAVHEVFQAQVARAPTAIAVVDDNLVLTYADLNVKANQLARYLISRGVKPGEYVPILMPRSAQLIMAQLAVLKAGAAYVPIDPALPLERRAFMIQDCAARHLVSDQDRDPASSRSQVDWIHCTTQSRAIKAQSGENLSTPVGALSPAYAMYTSGSTGVPKGVIIPHRGINRLAINPGYARFEPADGLAHCSNPAFDASTFEIWAALLNGARVVIVPRPVVLDTELLFEFLARHEVSILFLTTALFNQHANKNPASFAGLRYVLFGGEAADANTARQVLERGPPEHLINVYGPTESTTYATWYEITAIEEGTRSVPIGRPISNTQIHILDRRGRPVPIGVTGEIHVGGDGLALGYLNRADLTTQRFLPDSFSIDPRARLYRTGDLGRWDPEGNVEFLGRNDHQVKIRGFRIEPGEITSQLLRLPEVKETIVLARDTQLGEKQLVAYVVPHRMSPNMAGVLREHARAALPEYMIPSAWVFLDQLPLTGNGKIDRKALPAPSSEPGSSGYSPPTTETERTLAGIWASLLRIERVGLTDNFFELGGHSLLGMKLIARITDTFHVRLPSIAVFKYPTVGEMAAALEEAAAQQSAPKLAQPGAPALSSSRHFPLTYAQLARWRTYESGERRPMRQVASATRLCGALNVSWLRDCLNGLALRHTALRTRIIVLRDDPIPVQEILEQAHCELQYTDLTSLDPLVRQTEIDQIAARIILQPLNLGSDPLWTAHLVKAAHDDHVLIVAMEHLICDGYSMNVFLRDLIRAYEEAEGSSSPMPPSSSLPGSFNDYASRQHQTEPLWLERHRAHWQEQLFAFPRLHFPPDKAAPYRRGSGWGVVSVTLTNTLMRELQEWSQSRGTTVVMGALTAYAALLLRWCRAEESILQFQSDSRDSPELENTIGFFASVLYLRISLHENDRFSDLLARLKDEYCLAHEHADLSYIAAQPQPPAFTHNSVFNWVPKPAEDKRSQPGNRPGHLRTSTLLLPHVTFPALELDQEPGLLLCETAEEVICSVQFPRNRFSPATMEQFARQFLLFTETMVRCPQIRVSAVELHREISSNDLPADSGVT